MVQNVTQLLLLRLPTEVDMLYDRSKKTTCVISQRRLTKGTGVPEMRDLFFRGLLFSDSAIGLNVGSFQTALNFYGGPGPDYHCHDALGASLPDWKLSMC